MKFSIVILAAGAGTRMKSNTPKVLHKICGRAMLDSILNSALQVSDDVHIILYHQKEIIQDHIAKHYQAQLSTQQINIHTQHHEKYPGTGGALLDSSGGVIDFKYERIVVLNGDMPLIQAHTIQEIAKLDSEITLSILTLSNPQGYGRILFADSNKSEVIGIVEQKDCTKEQLKICDVNAGVYAFSAQALAKLLPLLNNSNAQKEYYLTDIIAQGVQSKLKVSAFYGKESEFIGVNSKADLAKAQEIRLEYLRSKAMESGVIMHIPKSIYIEEDVEFEGECEIENGVRICGKSKIIESKIKAHSVIEDSEIISSDVGPLAHIRPKSKITNTHIGNFVETKVAVLNGVKAGHLSYLGDCEIQKGSNIGAGVITCNYDGKAKHKTFIGENVFVGSDTQLVAPLNIESNVIIAAGSTITTDVKSGDLAISRIKQQNKKGFFYRFFRIKQ